MNGRCFRIILAIWILVAVPQVFSDSFPSHPTVTEMEATVMLGTECVRGVNERCQATQELKRWVLA